MKVFNSDYAADPVGPYPHSLRAGNLLFLSGIGPRERNSDRIPGVTLGPSGKIIEYDIEVQCHAVFKNVKLILESAGAKWTDLADITVFLTNMKDDFKIFNKVYGEYFKDHRPTRTTVEVTALPTPIAVEVKCIAYLEHR